MPPPPVRSPLGYWVEYTVDTTGCLNRRVGQLHFRLNSTGGCALNILRQLPGSSHVNPCQDDWVCMHSHSFIHQNILLFGLRSYVYWWTPELSDFTTTGALRDTVVDQARIKLFGAPRQWKHFRPLFQTVFFFGGGGYYPQTESNTTPPSPKTEITNILFYILNFASIIKF